jgi:hypothetical protein
VQSNSGLKFIAKLLLNCSFYFPCLQVNWHLTHFLRPMGAIRAQVPLKSDKNCHFFGWTGTIFKWWATRISAGRAN